MKQKTTFMKFFPLVGCCLAMCLTASTCGDNNDDPDEGGNNKNPNVAVTGTVEEVGTDYAIVNGEVNLEGISANYSSVEFGVEYSDYDDFAPKKRIAATSLVGRSFTIEISGLNSETKYYYRTYVTVPSLSYDYYGKTRNFTTGKSGSGGGGGGGGSDTPSGARYVDLGLTSGTLWATMNVGAKKPEQYGNYYAWGETTTKDYYVWSTYRYYNSTSDKITKYYYVANTDYFDKVNLDPDDDAAYKNSAWGSEWRMPTQAQIDELIRECDWEWKNQGDTSGFVVSSKKSGNNKSIFLPAAGYWEGSSVVGTGSYCRYWTKTVRTSGTVAGWSAHCISGNSVSSVYRYYGLPVRAVYVGK